MTDTTTEPDYALALGLLLAMNGDASEVRYKLLPGEPASKSRPRFGKGGRAYTSAESRAAEARTSALLRPWLPEPMTGNVAMACVFYRPNRQRIDVDNMLKHVCDAANGLLWHDDSQVTALLGIAQYDANNPRTLLAITAHDSTLGRGTDDVSVCKVCGNHFPRRASEGRNVTCSRECSARARGFAPLREPVPCAQCEQPFVRTTRAQKLCGVECRRAALRGSNRRRASEQPMSTCTTCGAQLAHRRGGRCRSCWAADSAAGPGDQS